MLKDLYYGKIIPWERHKNSSLEQRKVELKMEKEEQYFIEKIPLEDHERFQAFLQLYLEILNIEESDIFSHGFSMGILLMMDVYKEAELMKPEYL